VSATADDDVVRTPAEVAAAEREPLLVLEPLEAFLDGAGIGSGIVTAAPIGDGHSNVTYALERGRERVVLRRPPRGPLPPSAHDVLREARLLKLLRPAGVLVPEVLAVCDDADVIGAPFYVMGFVDGDVLGERLPPAYAGPRAARRIGEELVDALAALHALDVDAAGLGDFGRRGGYLARQVRRFGDLLERTATRPLPELERVRDWLTQTLPDERETVLVHGDYRLGNALFTAGEPSRPGAPGASTDELGDVRLSALLDWELATLGDPLADLGYLTAMWSEPGDAPNPMLDLSVVTRAAGFASRDQLAARYAERTGRSVDALGWYRVLALWKSAIFLEGSYGRHIAGSTDDRYFARLADGVPQLAREALRQTSG
jgi:aminoglycoside phosphotransferase (APT) family kinase protein